MFGIVSLLSHKLVTDKIVLLLLLVYQPYFGLVLCRFLVSSKSITHCSSCSVLKLKNAFKSIFQKISGYIKIKVTKKVLY